MDKLWAPWRVRYITKIHKKDQGCVFCRICRQKKDRENYILCRSRDSFAVLNIYPYNNGHVLIIPNRHVSKLSQLTHHERDDLMDLLDKSIRLLDSTLKPKGYNIGMNLGKIAGAGFPGHLHIHVVPRWAGDVNFMPVTAKTKVISQSLKILHAVLVKEHKKDTHVSKKRRYRRS